MGSMARMERCNRLAAALQPLLQQYAEFQPGDTLTVESIGAGDGGSGASVLGFGLSAVNRRTGRILDLSFADNLFDPDFTDREDLLEGLRNALPGAPLAELEAAVVSARLY